MSINVRKPHPDMDKFFNEAQSLFINLYSRWQDEHQFEDINEYKIPLDRVATTCNVSITQMTKRPFGCMVKCDDSRVYHMTINSRGQYKYERKS